MTNELDDIRARAAERRIPGASHYSGKGEKYKCEEAEADLDHAIAIAEEHEKLGGGSAVQLAIELRRERDEARAILAAREDTLQLRWADNEQLEKELEQARADLEQRSHELRLCERSLTEAHTAVLALRKVLEEYGPWAGLGFLEETWEPMADKALADTESYEQYRS